MKVEPSRNQHYPNETNKKKKFEEGHQPQRYYFSLQKKFSPGWAESLFFHPFDVYSKGPS